VAAAGAAETFDKARDLAAWSDLVPRQAPRPTSKQLWKRNPGSRT
jgi:hypothetical protein